MSKLPYLVPALVVAAAFAPALAGNQAKAEPPVSCEIRITASDGGLQLEPIATSKSTLSGSYELSVTTRSAGGASTATQAGEFSLAPGKPAILGSVVLGGSGTVSADLTLTWVGGSVSCSEVREPTGKI